MNNYIIHISREAWEEPVKKGCGLCHYFFNHVDDAGWRETRLCAESELKVPMDFFLSPYAGADLEIVDVPGEVVFSNIDYTDRY